MFRMKSSQLVNLYVKLFTDWPKYCIFHPNIVVKHRLHVCLVRVEVDPDLEGDGEGAGGSVGGGGARGGRVPDGAADPGDEGTHLHNTGNKALNECSRR